MFGWFVQCGRIIIWPFVFFLFICLSIVFSRLSVCQSTPSSPLLFYSFYFSPTFFGLSPLTLIHLIWSIDPSNSLSILLLFIYLFIFYLSGTLRFLTLFINIFSYLSATSRILILSIHLFIYFLSISHHTDSFIY